MTTHLQPQPHTNNTSSNNTSANQNTNINIDMNDLLADDLTMFDPNHFLNNNIINSNTVNNHKPHHPHHSHTHSHTASYTNVDTIKEEAMIDSFLTLDNDDDDEFTPSIDTANDQIYKKITHNATEKHDNVSGLDKLDDIKIESNLLDFLGNSPISDIPLDITSTNSTNTQPIHHPIHSQNTNTSNNIRNHNDNSTLISNTTPTTNIADYTHMSLNDNSLFQDITPPINTSTNPINSVNTTTSSTSLVDMSLFSDLNLNFNMNNFTMNPMNFNMNSNNNTNNSTTHAPANYPLESDYLDNQIILSHEIDTHTTNSTALPSRRNSTLSIPNAIINRTLSNTTFNNNPLNHITKRKSISHQLYTTTNNSATNSNSNSMLIGSPKSSFSMSSSYAHSKRKSVSAIEMNNSNYMDIFPTNFDFINPSSLFQPATINNNNANTTTPTTTTSNNTTTTSNNTTTTTNSNNGTATTTPGLKQNFVLNSSSPTSPSTATTASNLLGKNKSITPVTLSIPNNFTFKDSFSINNNSSGTNSNIMASSSPKRNRKRKSLPNTNINSSNGTQNNNTITFNITQSTNMANNSLVLQNSPLSSANPTFNSYKNTSIVSQDSFNYSYLNTPVSPTNLESSTSTTMPSSLNSSAPPSATPSLSTLPSKLNTTISSKLNTTVPVNLGTVQSTTTNTTPNVSAINKPFKCDTCGKNFRRSEHLKRHIRSVHSMERPFSCDICLKKFSRSDNLSQHLKTHKKHGDI
ncbi:hypothetical protein TBLA_0H02830 [Henningerozyma blattae CBS 6284]|uniref:C2H2-type domain-containing protein n=1 Tax=Henningerozyma blattae (strain ATCC 34711 / CBS 6284 / DSM 70876 / NBRC 10599 / NRRL Y-10934 / UCD 77-7) TaxID=1071380 RepID=I2H865_HENB6|nr:hypothetical protein TBLA_0H02830 [Tetrapisispora blattae CBS 6284]CCH62567.1 hypothetical protein TBLA_0H02830 [Tetrapisispora blattae CBS 6284]